MLGLSFANVAGVPAATWLGQNVGWRASYVAAALLAVLAAALIAAFVPSCPGHADATGRQELRLFFRNGQAWLVLLAGAIGFGGLFAVYSYIAPTVTEVGGLPESVVPLFVLAFGLGMVAGTWLAGELASWSVFGSLITAGVGSGLILIVFWFVAPYGWRSSRSSSP